MSVLYLQTENDSIHEPVHELQEFLLERAGASVTSLRSPKKGSPREKLLHTVMYSR
jgi:hypothetical protein